MYTTRTSVLVGASPPEVYRVLLDAESVAQWRVPEGMSARVHDFDAREGGRFRISLTYDAPSQTGKTTAHTDTYHGHFAKLVPDELVVEVVEFETTDPALRGEMTITTSLAPTPDGTEVVILHEGIPDVVPRADNETGTRMSLAKLARLAEGGSLSPGA